MSPASSSTYFLSHDDLQVHSGAGVSGVAWLILFVVQATREFVKKEKVAYSETSYLIP